MPNQTAPAVLVTTALALTSADLFAQCTTEWAHPEPLAPIGVIGEINEMAPWDPDGAGPQPVGAVVVGAFVRAGDVVTDNVALLDTTTQTYSDLGSGTNGPVHTVFIDANNDVVIAGAFTEVSGVAAQSIARWDGSAWHPYATGIDGLVLALEEDGNGHLIAGGEFPSAGGTSAHHVARWDGTAWQSMGSGFSGNSGFGIGPRVVALERMPNGDLIAGGNFAASGANTMSSMARWTGTDWTAHNTGLFIWFGTTDLIAEPNGDLIAIGSGVPSGFVRRSTSGQWTTIVPSTNPYSVHRTPNGRLFTTQPGVLAGVQHHSLNEVVNGALVPIGLLTDASRTTVCQHPNGNPDDLLIGGVFPGGSVSAYVNGTLSANTVLQAGHITSLAHGPDGTLYVGGDLTMIDGVPVAGLAAFDGTSWQAVGNVPGGIVRKIAVHPNGDVYVLSGQGAFASTPEGLYRWNGTSWQLVRDIFGPITLVIRPNGDVVASGRFDLGTWDGNSWQTFADGELVVDLVNLPNGDLAATSSLSWGFGIPDSNTAIWDGTSWNSTADPNISGPGATGVSPHGELLASEYSVNDPTLGHLRRWDGTSWQNVVGVTGACTSITGLPDGSVLLAGHLQPAGDSTHSQLVIWDGTTFASVLDVTTGSLNLETMVSAAPDGAIAAIWSELEDHISMRLHSCAPTATAVGNGCAHANGDNVLSSHQWPIVGAEYAAIGADLPSTCIVADAFGLMPVTVPLATVLPTALPGCTLHTDIAFLNLGVTTIGLFATTIPMPQSATLIGQSFRHQMFPIEIDAIGNLADITATNALELTIGAN